MPEPVHTTIMELVMVLSQFDPADKVILSSTVPGAGVTMGILHEDGNVSVILTKGATFGVFHLPRDISDG